jgi:hypothetical protein
VCRECTVATAVCECVLQSCDGTLSGRRSGVKAGPALGVTVPVSVSFFRVNRIMGTADYLSLCSAPSYVNETMICHCWFRSQIGIVACTELLPTMLVSYRSCSFLVSAPICRFPVGLHTRLLSLLRGYLAGVVTTVVDWVWEISGIGTCQLK